MVQKKKYEIDYSNPSDGISCAPGYHPVREHQRTCKSGKVTIVHEHMAKNPAHTEHSHYLRSNLYYLFQNGKGNYKPIGKICGFDEYEEVDPLIRFWLNYWESRGLSFPTDMEPKHVKALIAHESSFNPKAKAKSKRSKATGLMQVLNSTRSHLSGRADSSGWVEVKDEQIRITQDDLLDPLINVAAGTRWLAYKTSKIPKGKDKIIYNLLKNYNQWNAEGDKYAKKVLELYNAKCP